MDINPLINSPIEERVRDVLAPGGTLDLAYQVAGKRYFVNPKQLDYAGLVARTCDLPDPGPGQGGALSLIEGETGIGKSIGYLLPLALNAAMTGGRAMVSTHTNMLARQLLFDDGPLVIAAVEALLGKRVTMAQRIGRRNFVDMDRVRMVHACMRDGDAPQDSIGMLGEWLEYEPASFSDAAALGLGLPVGVSEADICLLSSSTASASAAYYQHVAESKDADILITNHSLSLLNAKCWTRLLDADRPARFAVFDEADALPQVARSLAESKLPLSTINALVEDMSGDSGRVAAAKAAKALQLLLQPLVADAPRIVEPSPLFDPLIAAVQELSGALRTAAEHEDHGAAQGLLEAVADLDDWLKAAQGDVFEVAVITASPVRSLPALVTVAVNPGRILNRLWRRSDDREPYLHKVIFTSATLAAPSIAVNDQPNFSDIMGELGFSGANNYQSALSRRIAPDRFGRMSFRLADRGVPSPGLRDDDGDVTSNPEWLDYVASGIQAARDCGGRVLVLTTSYSDAAALADRLPTVLVHQPGIKLTELVERYKADPAAVLITPAAWTGVSLPGLVDHLVIPRIPFPVPDEARLAVLARAMARRGKSEADAKWILQDQGQKNARRLLRQGIGRGIRTPDDICTVWLLDPRFPLPARMVENRRLRLDQGLAVKHTMLVSCIPVRFRIGQKPAFNDAKIHPAGKETGGGH